MGYAFVPQEHDSFTLESCSVRESIPARRNQQNDVKSHAKRRASARVLGQSSCQGSKVSSDTILLHEVPSKEHLAHL